MLTRVQSQQSAYNRPTCTASNRDGWEEQLLGHEAHPVRRLALQNKLVLIRHFDDQIKAVETQLQQLTNPQTRRDYTLLQTLAGIGEHLGLTILYEIGDISRFPIVKDFLSYAADSKSHHWAWTQGCNESVLCDVQYLE